MSRMIAAFEPLPDSYLSSTPSPPRPKSSCLAMTEKTLSNPMQLSRSQFMSEQTETAIDRIKLHDEASELCPPRIELVHSCEEISEQLLQIRDELQIGDSAAGVVQLRVFGA